MDGPEFEEKVNNLFADLPQSFKACASYYCWENHHSYGYSEVLLYLERLVNEVIKPGLTNMTPEEYARHHNK